MFACNNSLVIIWYVYRIWIFLHLASYSYEINALTKEVLVMKSCMTPAVIKTNVCHSTYISTHDYTSEPRHCSAKTEKLSLLASNRQPWCSVPWYGSKIWEIFENVSTLYDPLSNICYLCLRRTLSHSTIKKMGILWSECNRHAPFEFHKSQRRAWLHSVQAVTYAPEAAKLDFSKWGIILFIWKFI